jgi:hypothetical protein
MDSGGGVDGTPVGATVGVATALDELKSRGSALLIVGTVPEEVYARVSGCMLGDDSEPRRRLVVEKGTGPEVRYENIDRWTPEWTRIIECEIVSRRSAVAEGTDESPFDVGPDSPGREAASPRRPPRPNRSPSPRPSPSDPGDRDISPPNADGGRADVTVPVEGSIAELGVEIAESIGQFDAIAGALDPAELRVAFDCTASLLSAYDEQAVFRFLHVFTNHVRLVDGMAHVRLPKPLDSETTRLLEPLFDAVVELRLDGGEAQQRWHVRDTNVTSEWLPVDCS